MMFLGNFNAIAASRGDGLHPKLRELLERTAASPYSEVVVRHDGMIQAGPNPQSGEGEVRSSQQIEPQRLHIAYPG
jgi:hypothetical protein